MLRSTLVSLTLAAQAILCMVPLQATRSRLDSSSFVSSLAGTEQGRLDAIRHARVWTAGSVESADLKAGPQGPGAFGAGDTIRCDFVPRPHGRGSTLKFDCALPSGRELKVRYGRTNGEVYAQVAATRLLWALGFGANRMYPVRVECRGCAPNPFKQRTVADRSRVVVFDPATVDEKADGQTMESKPDEGWSWKELDLVDETAGGAAPEQRDAFKLLAVLIQHSSNKAINQRVLCLDSDGCARSQMIIVDLGKTFGRANALNRDAIAAVSFEAWSGMPVWKSTESGCVGNLPGSWSGTLHNPRIGEPGRKFLADLLSQLTDAQLRDLFRVARFTERDPSATVEDWVAAFKRKRAEIVQRDCSAQGKATKLRERPAAQP
jgi:hypothetical protein